MAVYSFCSLSYKPHFLLEYYFYFFKDLTDSKKVESDLIEARNKTELILASAAEGILGVDREGQIIFVNSYSSETAKHNTCATETIHKIQKRHGGNDRHNNASV